MRWRTDHARVIVRGADHALHAWNMIAAERIMIVTAGCNPPTLCNPAQDERHSPLATERLR